jgi:hypothetical protein
MIKKRTTYHSLLVLGMLCMSLLSLQVLNTAPITRPSDDQACQEKLDQAEESYYIGNLDQSILLVRQCLEDPSLSNDTRIRAYKIIARSYQTKEEPELAKNAVISLLQLNPDYQPTIEEESPRFIDLVTKTKTEQAQRQAAREAGSISPWVWIGAGGVAAAAVIVIVAGGSGSDEISNTNQPLPAPPMLP